MSENGRVRRDFSSLKSHAGLLHFRSPHHVRVRSRKGRGRIVGLCVAADVCCRCLFLRAGRRGVGPGGVVGLSARIMCLSRQGVRLAVAHGIRSAGLVRWVVTHHGCAHSSKVRVTANVRDPESLHNLRIKFERWFRGGPISGRITKIHVSPEAGRL